MTAATQEQQEELHTAPTGGPGGRLREIRVSRKLSLEFVASQLRLDPPRLEALENDAYDQLPGPAFVRGYLRGYARLVGVPAGPLLEAYDRYGFDTPALIPDITSRPQIRSTDVPVKLVTYVLAGLLLVLVGVWWFSHRESPVDAEPERAGQSPELPETVVEADRPVVLPPPPAPFADEAEPEAPVAVEPAPAPAEAAATPSAAVPEGGSGDADAAPAEGEATQAETADVADVTPAGPSPGDAPAAEAAPLADPAGQLEISFVHDSWVEIEDAAGESLFYGTAKGGETLEVVGRPPYRVLLGYAHEAEVKYNNELFDHRPYINKGLARFTLGEE